MTRLSRKEAIVGLAVAALIGAVVGVLLGLSYYNNHVGDWTIGVRALAIGVGVTIGAIAAAVLAWFAVDLTVTFIASIFDVIPALGSIGAGIYLLQYQSVGDAATGTSWFEIIGHGMGVYFIAKGLFIGRTPIYRRAALTCRRTRRTSSPRSSTSQESRARPEVRRTVRRSLASRPHLKRTEDRSTRSRSSIAAHTGPRSVPTNSWSKVDPPTCLREYLGGTLLPLVASRFPTRNKGPKG
jgi:hypothetical protein